MGLLSQPNPSFWDGLGDWVKVGKCEVNHGQEGDGELEGWKMRKVVVCKGTLLQRVA